MTQKTRYLLIFTGFVIFLILAPLIVLYVRGIAYDPATKSFVKTGILAAVIEPGDSQIFLNGKLARTSQGDVKFLTPGEYQIQIKKAGYQSWGKYLPVVAGQVTWANPPFSYVYLFYSSPTQNVLANNVKDFYYGNSTLAYLTADDFVVGPVSGPQPPQGRSYTFPKPVNQILAEDQNAKNFVLTNSAYTTPAILVFNSDSGKFSDISSLFASIPQMQFGDNGGLYALSDGTLYNINATNKTKTALFSDVKGFYFQGGSLYFVQQQSTQLSLSVSQSPFLAAQQLLTDLPPMGAAQLFVTYGKQIFLLSGGNLYLASSAMQNLSQGVQTINFDSQSPAIPLIQNGELDYYDTSSGNLNFITRNSQAMANPIITNGIGYAFFSQNNTIQAIELDTRDSQNQYTLYSGASLSKFFVDPSAKNIFLLDGGELKSLVIR